MGSLAYKDESARPQADRKGNGVADRLTLQTALDDYKRDFVDKTWPEEKYKWQAVKHFQDNWELDAEDFPAMLKRSLEKTGNLLASAGSFPRFMIERFSRSDPERVRAMFAALFDESADLHERMEAFKNASDSFLESDGSRMHFQDENTISTYLWLRYPDKYYIYKWGECRAVSNKLALGYRFKKGDYANNVRDHFTMYGAICAAAQADPDLRNLLDSQLTDDCYPDPALKTLTIDIAFYISDRMTETGSSDALERSWWPSQREYVPGLSADDWENLLRDKAVFDPGSLEVMKRMKDIGGQSSCVGLANRYGRGSGFYNGTSSALGRRVAKATGCPTVKDELSNNSKWWPVLYTGRSATNDEQGTFIWRLRDELSEALDRVDLSTVPLYDENSELEEPNYWWLVASPHQKFRFANLDVGGLEGWSLVNDNGRKRNIYQNFLDADEGDLVVGYESHPVKQVVALGRIGAKQDGEHLWFEKTEGLVTPIDYSIISGTPELADMQALATNMRGSLFKLTKAEYETILDLVRESNPLVSPKQNDPYTKEEFLSEVYMSESDYDRLVNVLRRKKNLILQGAPGVGKTFAAQRLAWSIMGQRDADRVAFIQFHQNYSYEDFMMGYKPTDQGFELRRGIFYEFCKKAENNPSLDFFFIIDEINRGNLSKIFGELLMLIESDYRGKSATLAYSGEAFSVPANVHIIGMMNTADRSLAMIDYALRRRFSFVPMTPGFDTEGFRRYQTGLDDQMLDQLVVRVQTLNAEISKDPSLGSGFCIGHSYFCGQDTATPEWMRAVVDYDLMPMLEEYWFDDDVKVERWRGLLCGVVEA